MAEQEKEPLFLALPEDLKSLSDAEVQKLLDDSVSAAALIEKDDEEFLAGLSADEIIAELATGVEQIKALQAENKERVQAYENYKAEKAAKLAELAEEEPKPDDEDEGDESKPDEAEVVAEAEPVADETPEAETVVEEQVPVTAAAPTPRFSRTPPAPARERIVVETPQAETGPAMVASAQFKAQNPDPLDHASLANLMRDVANDLGPSHDGRGMFNRALARRQLGPSCPTGLVLPEADEVAATLQDWLDEFERIQLMLRLSGRLRQKHGD